MSKSSKEKNPNKVQVHHSKKGVLYAKPKDILRSENARKQVRALKRSSIYKEMRSHTHKETVEY